MCLSRKKCYFPSGCVRVCSVCVCPHICLHHTSHTPPHTHCLTKHLALTGHWDILANQSSLFMQVLQYSKQSDLSSHASSAIFQLIRSLFSCKFCNIPTNQIYILIQNLEYCISTNQISFLIQNLQFFNQSDFSFHAKSAIFQPSDLSSQTKFCNIQTIRSLFTK